MQDNIASLGLSRRVKDTYSKKTTEDVIREMDSITVDEAWRKIKEHFKNQEFLKKVKYKASFNDSIHHMITAFCSCGLYNYGPLLRIDLEVFIDDGRGNDDSMSYIAFKSPSFFLMSKRGSSFVKTYLDFAIDADVLPTYKWKEIYQNESSLPYSLTNINVNRVINAIEDHVAIGEQVKQYVETKYGNDYDKLREKDIETIAKKFFKKYIVDDIWKFAGQHGAPVAADESVRQNQFDITPADIVRRSREIGAKNLENRLAQAILETSGLNVSVSIPLRGEKSNTITLNVVKTPISKTIELEESENTQPDYIRDNIIEEKVSKAVVSMLH